MEILQEDYNEIVRLLRLGDRRAAFEHFRGITGEQDNMVLYDHLDQIAASEGLHTSLAQTVEPQAPPISYAAPSDTPPQESTGMKKSELVCSIIMILFGIVCILFGLGLFDRTHPSRDELVTYTTREPIECKVESIRIKNRSSTVARFEIEGRKLNFTGPEFDRAVEVFQQAKAKEISVIPEGYPHHRVFWEVKVAGQTGEMETLFAYDDMLALEGRQKQTILWMGIVGTIFMSGYLFFKLRAG